MAKTKKKKRKLNIPRIVMLALIFVMTVAVIIIAVVLTNAKTKLVDQTAAIRWGNGERFAHISAFLSKEQQVDYNTIRQLRNTIEKSYIGKSTMASFKPFEDGSPANLVDAYCAFATVTLATDHASKTYDAIGIGGDFFTFHPMQLITGNYFSESDLMHDYILLDEEAAEQIFGGSDVAGQRLTANGRELVVAGVYKRKQGTIENLAAGGEEPKVFLCYDMLNELNGGGAPSSGSAPSSNPSGNSGSSGSSTASGAGSADAGGASGSSNNLCITCYELLGPDPINHFAYDVLKDTKVFTDDGVQYIENSSRFSYARYFELLKARKSREMRTDDIALPFWENIARYKEGRLMYAAFWQWVLMAVLFVGIFSNIMNFLIRHKPTKKKFEEIMDKIHKKTHHIPEKL